MTAAEAVLGLMLAGVIVYVLLGGADFGGGFWDLLAGGPQRGSKPRALIEHSIAPVWEANHVWLIFALVVLWTGFPPAFAAIASTLYVPLTAAAFGIILRGSGFAFRKAVDEVYLKRLFGGAFALSSVLTPFFLGTIAGAVASGRVPPGNAAGDPIGSWLNPTSLLSGIFAVAVCAYLAAVYLTGDAERSGEPELVEYFRRRALGTALLAGLVAAAGIVVLRADAPELFEGLLGRGLPMLPVSLLGGAATIWFVARRRHLAARAAAAIAVVGVLGGWAAGQYPNILQGMTIEEAAASPSTLRLVLISLTVGGLFFVPGLVWMLLLFHRGTQAAAPPGKGMV